jgi:hypothetical protein
MRHEPSMAVPPDDHRRSALERPTLAVALRKLALVLLKLAFALLWKEVGTASRGGGTIASVTRE